MYQVRVGKAKLVGSLPGHESISGMLAAEAAKKHRVTQSGTRSTPRKVRFGVIHHLIYSFIHPLARSPFHSSICESKEFSFVLLAFCQHHASCTSLFVLKILSPSYRRIVEIYESYRLTCPSSSNLAAFPPLLYP